MVIPGGYGYCQFCELCQRRVKIQDKLVMRVVTKAGEEVQVYYAVQTVFVVEPKTGENEKHRSSLVCWEPVA